MKVVIVTGGIGSGKSTACRYLLEKYGWPVYEADVRVKELYREHPALLRDIEDELGVTLRDEDGCFVPQLLAAVIFNDGNALSRVEELVFPVLTEDFERWKSEHSGCGYAVLESATILEKPSLRGMGDITVLIDAPVLLRADRAAARSGVSRETIMRRMANQPLMNDISDGRVSCPAEYLIKNDGSTEKLKTNIDKLVKKLC